ncbi:MAG: nicotinate-nucleotide--dimethylbenzimidazole phosphoribosyltransferase [Aquincola sp.]|nr:nicotinate-nucleotide--dimethylbenzimidazole phosphoribosyltransferase [Aquincola sp.]MDH4290089.1 nicotinate-nucleotide--dimethylbenzimidazole phosphoribosyltransferase [Aquincola sp.]MDH5328731.1 nicotinate-nucleotide--dimethylbenzimidazole phosphoribosyltransferase [Aquincola sp.]
MHAATTSLIAPTANPLLERALRDKLQRRGETAGSLGELEPLAVRIGLIQNTLKPRFRDPQLVLFASDNGLAVEGITAAPGHGTAERVWQALRGQLPVSVFAAIQGMNLSVVDAGVAERLPPHERLLMRKIAHGTRNSRVGAAMTVEQAHAAIRAGMEIGQSLPGNVLACAGIGVGGQESAALILSRLAAAPVRELLQSHPQMDSSVLTHLLVVTQGAQGRHRDVHDPVEVLAAFGGFDIAMMAGAMLVAAGRRHLVIVDGLPACAALMVAARIAAPVTDYCVFCRSHSHNGLDYALNLFHASALLELGMESTDGTGSTLAWPLLRAAASLLTEVAEGEDPGPTRPGELGGPQA